MHSIIVALLAAGPAQPPAHDARNPLYKELLGSGLLIGPDVRAPLPPPTMPDGLDPAKQRAVIEGLIGKDYGYAEFTRKSVVAPHLLRLRDVQPSDPKAPGRGVDLWFVTYGDFAATEDEKFLERLLNAGRGEGSGKTLTREDLAKRKIPPPADEKREGFGFAEFDFLEKVRLKVVGQVAWTRTADSVLAAGRVDPRFVGDPEFPSQWQPLTRGPGGAKAGQPEPYTGGGFYLKITRLAEPAGALFVEQHVVFAEPAGWFGGANLLRSKLPPVVQNNVRTMRREFFKTAR